MAVLTGENILFKTMETSLGQITAGEQDGKLVSLVFTEEAAPPFSSPLLDEVHSQLEAYFSGKLKKFDIPLSPAGTAFQRQVWEQLLTIPFGQTLSYSDIARKLGDLKRTRAVGLANGDNPVAIIVPCHRVIGSNGALTGYAGGLWRKQWLLQHEAKVAHGVQELF